MRTELTVVEAHARVMSLPRGQMIEMTEPGVINIKEEHSDNIIETIIVKDWTQSTGVNRNFYSIEDDESYIYNFQIDDWVIEEQFNHHCLTCDKQEAYKIAKENNAKIMTYVLKPAC